MIILVIGVVAVALAVVAISRVSPPLCCATAVRTTYTNMH